MERGIVMSSKNSSVKKVLIKARAKIENPNNWCQWYYARDKFNHLVSYQSNTACKWCITGALFATDTSQAGERLAAWARLEQSLPVGYEGVVVFNDSEFTQHSDVLKLFDKAIASCGDE